MATTPIRFFSPATKLGVLEADIQELEGAAHAPPEHLERAEKALAEIRLKVLRTHEAQLQVSIATSAGFDEHRRVWQAKIAAIDQQIVDATAALRGIVEELRVQRFQRFAAAMVIGTVVLRWLFDPPGNGKPPPVLRSYIQESVFISTGQTAAGGGDVVI